VRYLQLWLPISEEGAMEQSRFILIPDVEMSGFFHFEGGCGYFSTTAYDLFFLYRYFDVSSNIQDAPLFCDMPQAL
jgi:hypothetical protein